MKASKQPCQTVLTWLRENLGKNCTAPLTNTDRKALFAAVQIVELYAYCDQPDVAVAFGKVVQQMQRHTWHLAYHAVAHVMDWSHRLELWKYSGLASVHPAPTSLCKWEPASRAQSSTLNPQP